MTTMPYIFALLYIGLAVASVGFAIAIHRTWRKRNP